MLERSESNTPALRFTYPRRMRLSGSCAFLDMRQSAVRLNVGPLQFQGRPNGLGQSRLGLSVSRRVGTAVLRNRIKRLLREAFRLGQHDWPATSGTSGVGYDLVISVRAHLPMPLTEYRAALGKAMRSLHETWSRKAEKSKRQANLTSPSKPRDE